MTSATQPQFAELLDPAVRADPYPLFHRFRDASPLTVVDGDLVVIADYARADAILRDPSMSSERHRSNMARNANRAGPAIPSFLTLDPPDHTRLRRLVSKAFTPRVVAGLRPRITEIVAGLFGAVDGPFEVVSQLAYPLPVQVISELLGVPDSDHELFVGWSRRLVRGLDPLAAVDDAALLADITAAREELNGYLDTLIARRRADPGDDLLSGLIRIEEQGDVLSADELRSTCVLLLVAGHETTVNLIANGVLALLRNEDVLARLRADPGLADRVVEETLRFDPPVQLTGRVARTALDIGGTRVNAGGSLMLLIGGANRDPAQFPAPDRFDIDRGVTHHLAFAAGPHFCLGANLARLEAAVALDAFASRVHDPELDIETLSYRPHVTLRGPERIDVRHAGLAATPR